MRFKKVNQAMPQKIYLFCLLLFCSACSPSIDTPLRQIKYPNTDMRVHAAEKLGESGHPDAAPALIEALNDEKVRVRLAAINALGQLKDTRATMHLLPFLNDKRITIVFATIEALGAISDSSAVASLSHFVASEIPTTRVAAIDALGKIGSPRALDVLSSQIWNDTPAVRSVTALALGRIGQPQSIRLLLHGLSDPTEQVHKMALYALDRIDENWRERKEVGHMFLLFKDDLMNENIVGNDAALTRFGILNALNTIDPNWRALPWTQDVIWHYESFLQSPTMRERWVAARVLGELGDPRAVDALIQATNDPDYSVRAKAILSLGKLGDTRAVPVLREILKGDDLSIKNPAIAALANLADTASVPLMLAQLTPEVLQARGRNQGGHIPYAVAVALGDLKAPEGISVLRKLLLHPNAGVRHQAVASLGKVGDKTVVDEVVNLLQDRKLSVRSAAAKSLGRLGADRATPDLIALLGTDKVSDRALVTALDQLDAQWRTSQDAEQKIDHLTRRFKIDRGFTQQQAVVALAEIGGEQAHEVLLAVLKSRNLGLIAKTHTYYIHQGVTQALPALRQALDRHGTQKMVKTYLASGHPALTESARAWAHAHGMALVSLPEIETARWSGG